ncbi:MAG TPA: DUF4279 domain-containing protein [Edaphobacter sp.]|jgi:hypothetical protein|nr:DUF4279 domain-containing protein [Edaphobacter sp.]
MTRPNEYRAYFTLVGEFDPADISTRLGLEPTSSWKKGDLNPKTQLERKHSRWNLNSRLGQSTSLEEQVRDVLEQLKVCSPTITDLRATVDGGMQLIGYFYTDYPGFGLDHETLSELGQLRPGIDCDFYYLYSEKREDS